MIQINLCFRKKKKKKKQCRGCIGGSRGISWDRLGERDGRASPW